MLRHVIVQGDLPAAFVATSELKGIVIRIKAGNVDNRAPTWILSPTASVDVGVLIP